MTAQNKNWIFTWNNYTASPLLQPHQRYLAFSYETAPTTGTPHLQGFVVYHKKVRLTTVLKDFPCGAKSMKGRIDQNVAYCSKSSELIEQGDRPADRKSQADDQAFRYQAALDLAALGKFDAIEPALRTRFYRTYEHHFDVTNRNKKLENLAKLDNTWIHGPSGTGKSRLAQQMAPDAYIKTENKWWDDYKGQPDVIIDDVHRNWAGAHQLKKWADIYPVRVEVKGSSKMIRPSRIIVTSNYSPAEVFTEEQDLLPIKRKFNNVVHKLTRDDDTTLGLAYVEPVQKKRKYKLPVDNKEIVTVD